MAQILYYKAVIESILDILGYKLEPNQPHLSDEGLLLMRDKRVLIGRRSSDNLRVIIKLSTSRGGRKEIADEKAAQDTLSQAIFSQEQILFPKEIDYWEDYKAGENYTIRITEFIEQEQVFAALPLEKQFFMIMREFEAEESFYANTYEHINVVKKVFPVTHANDYIEKFESFDVGERKTEAAELLRKNKELIETRSNYLTHTDFAPSNFRVKNGKIYMIDLSSMHFGNRYEGLARMLNYCIIHDPELGRFIVEYIKTNRNEGEYLCLRLMRIYKAGFLINHYAKALGKTSDNLHKLTEIRLKLWRTILGHLIDDSPVESSLIDSYKAERDSLRSASELERQKQFNLL
ncbi:hypothetical protein KW800_03015 [Candidatus Parcubacteria bacterium]|nr:hypothetical protein [Candidatus Parcubacteria bacterium]